MVREEERGESKEERKNRKGKIQSARAFIPLGNLQINQIIIILNIEVNE